MSADCFAHSSLWSCIISGKARNILLVGSCFTCVVCLAVMGAIQGVDIEVAVAVYLCK